MQIWKYLTSFLILLTILLWIVVFNLPDNNLHLIACDVGQGDAILTVYKNYQILTDGGTPDKKVIDCIGRHVPFWDRHIEVVVNTHPQLDHYGGLTEVFKRYKVDYFIANALSASAQDYQVLRKEVGSKGVHVVNPTSGTTIRLGLMSYDIFWPSFAFLASEGMPSVQNKLGDFTSKRDPNDFSVQALVSLGNFNGLLTGDIGENMAELVFPYLPNKSVQYIKVPHHGSKYGLTQKLLEKYVPGGLPRSNPQHEPFTNSTEKASAKVIGGISVGEKNSYGHPTREILDLLNQNNVKTYRTDTDGDIEIVTDGKVFWAKKTGNLFSF